MQITNSHTENRNDINHLNRTVLCGSYSSTVQSDFRRITDRRVWHDNNTTNPFVLCCQSMLLSLGFETVSFRLGEDRVCIRDVCDNASDLNSLTWMTSPSPSNPASRSGVSVVVALCTTALAAAFRIFDLWLGETRSTSGLTTSCMSKAM